MCFLSVDLRLQMLMDRSLLAIVSLMVFQIFVSKYKEYKDIGILYLIVLNVSMLQWYTYKLWTVMRLC